MRCEDIVAEGFDWDSKNAELYGTEEEYANYSDKLNHIWIHYIDDEYNGFPIGAELSYDYGTYIKSQEPICFTGDFFKFISPSCVFYSNFGL